MFLHLPFQIGDLQESKLSLQVKLIQAENQFLSIFCNINICICKMFFYSQAQEPVLKMGDAEQRPESKMYGGNIDLVSRRENVQVVACTFSGGLLSF